VYPRAVVPELSPEKPIDDIRAGQRSRAARLVDKLLEPRSTVQSRLHHKTAWSQLESLEEARLQRQHDENEVFDGQGGGDRAERAARSSRAAADTGIDPMKAKAWSTRYGAWRISVAMTRHRRRRADFRGTRLDANLQTVAHKKAARWAPAARNPRKHRTASNKMDAMQAMKELDFRSRQYGDSASSKGAPDGERISSDTIKGPDGAVEVPCRDV